VSFVPFVVRNWSLRIAAIALGGGFLVWIPFEDTTTTWVLFFATAICLLGGASLLANRQVLGSWSRTGRGAFLGGLAGLAVTPLAIGLMAFKSGLHGHNAPDFTLAQMQAALDLFPYFALAGLGVGLAAALRPRAPK
jgi:hypothetical protein